MTCKARQYSDQMNCHACNLVWDVNDPDPPKCKDAHPPLAKTEDEINQYRKAKMK